MADFGISAVYVKIHHGDAVNQQALSDLNNGWARRWHEAGFLVLGWGWIEGDMRTNAETAVGLCTAFDLDGYIADGEDGIEGANRWKSAPFVNRFRELAPRAPLGLSYIGDGYPYRILDFDTWIEAGAALLPQCYWTTSATSIQPSLDALDRLNAPEEIVFPTLGTSSFQTPYPAEFYHAEMAALGQAYSVWLLESTTDDYLRTLQP